MRPAALAFLLLCFAAVPALADDPGDAPPGRYQLAPSREGFVRLDTRTGATSHCGFDGKAWVCEPLGETDSPLAARVDALTEQVASLTATVRRLTNEIARRPSPAAEVPPPRPGAASFATRAVAPLFDFVRRLKARDDSA